METSNQMPLFDAERRLTPHAIEYYAYAMVDDRVDELPRDLIRFVEEHSEYRTQIIDYYLWLSAPETRARPVMVHPLNSKRVDRKKQIVGWIAAACILLVMGGLLYPTLARWRQESAFAASFTENPSREAIFMYHRMGSASNAPHYTFQNLLTSTQSIPQITSEDAIHLKWKLQSQDGNFEPQEVTLQLWDTQGATPVEQIKITQSTQETSYTLTPQTQPGIYYCRLVWQDQTETLAKIYYYNPQF